MNDFLTKPCPRLLLALGAALISGVAWGGEDTNPLFLTASETLMRDSNFSRTDVPQPETTSSTALQFGVNKDYGRQNYRLNAQVSANRYAHYKELLNNQSNLINGGFRTDFLRNWQLNLGGSDNRSLNPIKDNLYGDRVIKNVRKYRDGNGSLRYGLDGDWSVTANIDRNHVDYSEPTYFFQNARQKSRGVKVDYYATDALSYGLGWRYVNTYYPVNRDNLTISDRNLDLSTTWQVTGLSSLSAVLTRRSSGYSTDDTKRNKGWNGSLNWGFTPQGLLNYSLSASKTTGTDRQTDTFSDAAGAKKVSTLNNSTNYRAQASARVTAKTVLSYSYGLTKTGYNYSNLGAASFIDSDGNVQQIVFNDRQSNRNVSHVSTFSVQVSPIRSVSTQCNLQLYSQTRDQNNFRYQGREFDCTASFTID
jgi:hypothetical protein